MALLDRIVGSIWNRRGRLYSLLDRPGGRSLLSAFATFAVRRESGADVAVAYHGAWLFRVGRNYLSTGQSRFVQRDGGSVARALEQQEAETSDYWFHVYRPRMGDVIIDAGAYTGGDAVVFSRLVGASGRVLAIEAHPTTFGVLETVVRLNRLTNVLLSECAVAARRGRMYIDDKPLDETAAISSAWSTGRRHDGVEAIPLDDLCRSFGLEQIDFVKMNIEGAELEAIHGMSETFARSRYICIACHDFLAERGEHYRTRDRVVSELRRHGFTIVTRPDDPRPWVRDHIHGFRGR